VTCVDLTWNDPQSLILKIRFFLKDSDDDVLQSGPVIPKLVGAHRSGEGNAPKLNYQLMKLSIYLLTLQNP
jgi:hypothetical protein